MYNSSYKKIYVKTLTGKTFPLSVEFNTTIKEVKLAI